MPVSSAAPSADTRAPRLAAPRLRPVKLAVVGIGVAVLSVPGRFPPAIGVPLRLRERSGGLLGQHLLPRSAFLAEVHGRSGRGYHGSQRRPGHVRCLHACKARIPAEGLPQLVDRSACGHTRRRYRIHPTALVRADGHDRQAVRRHRDHHHVRLPSCS